VVAAERSRYRPSSLAPSRACSASTTGRRRSRTSRWSIAWSQGCVDLLPHAGDAKRSKARANIKAATLAGYANRRQQLDGPSSRTSSARSPLCLSRSRMRIAHESFKPSSRCFGPPSARNPTCPALFGAAAVRRTILLRTDVTRASAPTATMPAVLLHGKGRGGYSAGSSPGRTRGDSRFSGSQAHSSKFCSWVENGRPNQCF